MGEQSASADDLIISDLQTQVRELKDDHERQRQELLTLTAERDNYRPPDELRRDLEQMHAERDRLWMLAQDLTSERDGARSETNALRQERDTLREQLESYKEQWRRAYEQRTAELESETERQRAESFTSHLNDEVHDARDDEREACAKVADIEAGEAVDDWTNQNAAKGSHFASKRIAAAIRARGAK